MKKLKLQVLFVELLTRFCHQYFNLDYEEIKESIFQFLEDNDDTINNYLINNFSNKL